jgi:hypothetical protein
MEASPEEGHVCKNSPNQVDRIPGVRSDSNSQYYCVLVGALFDPRSNANLGQQSMPDPDFNGGRGCVNSGAVLCAAPISFSSYYDSAGRNGAALSWSDSNPGVAGSKFDVENHTVQSENQVGIYGFVNNYAWGPNGHPLFYQDSQGNSSNLTWPFQRTVHWDGDSPLFVTGSDGSIREINLPGIGTMVPHDRSYTGFTVWDRDPTGQVISAHNSTGAGGLYHRYSNPERQFGQTEYGQSYYSYACGYAAGSGSSGVVGADTFNAAVVVPPDGANPGGPSSCATQVIQQPGVPSGVDTNLLFDIRGEGQSDGVTNIQGVRASNSDTIQWTTPDLYAGEVGDPMSQQRYMWNRNNPVSYSDPTGFSGDDCHDRGSCKPPDKPAMTAQQAIDALNKINGVMGNGSQAGKDVMPTAIGILLFIVPEAKAAEGAAGVVTLFRVVGPTELKDVIAAGAYRLGPGNEVKYFAQTMQQAQAYAAYYSGKTGENYAITSAVFHTSNLPAPIRDFGYGLMHVLDASHMPHGPVTLHLP